MDQEHGVIWRASGKIPLCLWDIPNFNLHLHRYENISNDKSLTLEDKNEFSTEAGQVEKHCIVDLIYGNLFLLKKKSPIKRW